MGAQEYRGSVEPVITRSVETAYEPATDYDAILKFLSQPETYAGGAKTVEVRETHMSMVFLAGDRVYKLKRPIKLGFLDFRTLEARRRSCEAELAINQAMAPGVYLRTLPVVRGRSGQLTLGGEGEVREWLIVMRRLDEGMAFDRMLEAGRIEPTDLDRLCDALATFYRGQPALEVSAETMMEHWHQGIQIIAESLTDPMFELEPGLTDPPLYGLKRFLVSERAMIEARVEEGRIVEGHGDLKPEHVYFGPSVLIIDRLEFDERLRWCDPFDEISFLGLECGRLGFPDVLPHLVDELASRLGDRPPEALLRFYRCYRACLRARLSIEHLRDETPRTPERWPRQTRAYLRLAAEVLPLSD